ncbi:MAG: TylF/MycF/NovP-related O-methyltransferase [Acidimicrobiales bacterium]
MPGAIAECGVFTGGTAQLLALTVQDADERRDLHLFDTFSGMPETADPARDYHQPGDFSETSVGAVRTRLSGLGDCHMHVGLIPATFAEVAMIDRYAFVHVDVDIYDSTLECCRWFWPRLVPGGTIVFDDYGFYPYRHAARAAVDEYFAVERRQPIVLPTGQAFVTKPG